VTERACWWIGKKLAWVLFVTTAPFPRLRDRLRKWAWS
jgi:hypothetical protein